MFSERILKWYDAAQRELPWRKKVKNPYHIWLSEIMLQQTTVATAIPYFQNFIKKWPSVEDLAAATLDEVLTQWQGLGYYSRARNLHKCAQVLAKTFPSHEKDLLALPGIGPYTAAAIASIAFNKKAIAIDGNVIRVISRYFALKILNPIKEVKKELENLLPDGRYGDFTQALMELGALICRPKSPTCTSCPLQEKCQAYKQKAMEDFPLKRLKQRLPTRYATAFILKREDGAILLRKRPPEGLLGGMMEVPTTPWESTRGEIKGALVRHTFTHFHLEVSVRVLSKFDNFEGIWVHPRDFSEHALPTVMKKILKAGLQFL